MISALEDVKGPSEDYIVYLYRLLFLLYSSLIQESLSNIHHLSGTFSNSMVVNLIYAIKLPTSL